MPHTHPSELVVEFLEKCDADWGDHAAPLQVNRKGFRENPFIPEYSAISELLGNVDEVAKCLTIFERQMYESTPRTYRYSFKNLRRTDAEVIDDISKYLRSRNKMKNPADKNPKLKKLFSNALGTCEKAHGFDERGAPVTLTGGIDGEIFQRDLVANGRRWKDVGVPGEHGEHTHRLQWYVIAASGILSTSVIEVYRSIGSWIWTRAENPKYMALWDAMFDRHPTDNPFPPHNDLDFRSPENLCKWIILDENAAQFPLLHAYLKARFEKRRDPEFSIKDYLAKKLYRTDIAGLQAEYERTGDKTKLEKIAAETDSPVELGEGRRAKQEERQIYQVGANTKIIERSSYAPH